MTRPSFSPEQRLAIANEIGIIVDEADRWLLTAFTWMVATNGYIRTWWKGKTYPFHHFVIGVPLFGMDVDHINRIRHDNRRDNLRIVTRGQNNMNTLRSEKTTHIYQYNGKFKVNIQRDCINYQKEFWSMDEAIEYRDNVLASLK